MEALSEDRELFPESKAMIKSYLLALPTLEKNTGRDSKEPLGTLIEKLDATTPARPLGLYLVDKYDVAGATTEDMLSLLNWAVLVGCQELIEDLWKFRRGLAAMAGTKSGPSPIFPAIHSNDSGSAETIKALLDWPRFEPNPCWNGKSALAVASEIGHDRAVELLLEHGVSPNDPDGSALVLSIRNKHLRVVQCLVKAGADTNLTVDSREEEGSPGEIKTTALHSAIGWDNSVVKLLLEHRANPDSSKYSGGKTPLFLAAEVGDTESVNLLLKYGAKVEATNDNGAYPVLTAIERGHHGIVKLLIENMPISNIFQVLPVAVRLAQQKVVDLLLAQGADPAMEDDEGSPLLLVAVEKGEEGITKTLLAAGAKTNARSADGSKSPLHAAIRSGNWHILSALLDPAYEADVNLKVKEWQTPLALAVDLGHSATIQLLLQRGANLDAECHYDSEGEGPDGIGTVLHLAAARGNLETVNLLLEAGVSPAAKDHAGRTPLLLVAMHDPTSEMILERLLRAGASPNVVQQEGAAATTGGGSTALHLAIAAENRKAIDLLLQHGADLEAWDGAGRTPLMAVVDRPYRSREQTVMARQLLAAGANPNATVEGSDGANVLQTAAWLDQEEVVHELLGLGADVNPGGARYGSALQAAASGWAGKEVVQMLLAAGADITAVGGEHGSALHAALAVHADQGVFGSTDVLEMLLRHPGVDAELVDSRGLTPLLKAVVRNSYPGRVDVVKLLLKHGASTEATYGERGTALLIAAADGDATLVEVLLQHGADKEARDGRSRTALLVACEKGHREVAKLLLDVRADVTAKGGLYGTAMQGALYRGDG
jgi:ankyrin repeat protein